MALLYLSERILRKLKMSYINFSVHRKRDFKQMRLYWQIFWNPILLDEWSDKEPLRARSSNFGHPKLFFRSNSSFPEIGQPINFKCLSSGCFLLSILLKNDYGILIPFSKITYISLVFVEKENRAFSQTL